jgi:hypothetical protein
MRPFSFWRSEGSNHRFVFSNCALVMTIYISTTVSFPKEFLLSARFAADRDVAGRSLFVFEGESKA